MEMLLCELPCPGIFTSKLIRNSYDDGKSLEPTNPVIGKILCEYLLQFIFSSSG